MKPSIDNSCLSFAVFKPPPQSTADTDPDNRLPRQIPLDPAKSGQIKPVQGCCPILETRGNPGENPPVLKLKTEPLKLSTLPNQAKSRLGKTGDPAKSRPIDVFWR
jgi:hypothetical protein